MEPIRVLNLFTILNRGGAETMVMNYYRKMDKRRVQFDFLVHRQERGDYEEEIRDLGGKIYRMPPVYAPFYGKKIRFFLEEHPEYGILHSHMSELGYTALREGARLGIPVRICHAHNAPVGWNLKMPVRQYLKKQMMPYITHMFMCGKTSGDWLFGSEWEDRFIQLNNAVETEKFRRDIGTEHRMRRELGLEGDFVVGHVGRFHSQKNHDFLIEIFAKIAKHRTDAKLMLVGNGPLEEKIQRKVKKYHLEERVLFLGVRKDVECLMQCMDVFVFPSYFEGLSMAVIEAQAAGLPCFIAKSIPKECCITEQIQRISLDEGADNWAEQILQRVAVMKKKDTVQQIRKAGFDMETNVTCLEEFYVRAGNGEEKDYGIYTHLQQGTHPYQVL